MIPYQISDAAALEEGVEDGRVSAKFPDVLDHLHQPDANDGGLKATIFIEILFRYNLSIQLLFFYYVGEESIILNKMLSQPDIINNVKCHD